MSFAGDDGRRHARWLTLPNLLLVACAGIAVWFVFVPLAANNVFPSCLNGCIAVFGTRLR